MENTPEGMSEDIVHEIEDALSAREGDLSEEEVDAYLRKLDTAIAISNNEGARQLRSYLVERFRSS